MNHTIVVHADAETEILQALAWYAARSALAARAFVQEMMSMVVLADRSPEFDLVFRMKGETIEIVAVAHHRRRPWYWRNR